MNNLNLTVENRIALTNAAKQRLEEENQSGLVSQKGIIPDAEGNFKVIVHDSDKHSDQYVSIMLGRIFKADAVSALAFALKMTTEGKAPLFTGTREHCRVLCREIASFGGDNIANALLGNNNQEGLHTEIVRADDTEEKGLVRANRNAVVRV